MIQVLNPSHEPFVKYKCMEQKCLHIICNPSVRLINHEKGNCQNLNQNLLKAMFFTSRLKNHVLGLLLH
jgi:hypothetical protein